jgi:hypothetical protein
MSSGGQQSNDDNRINGVASIRTFSVHPGHLLLFSSVPFCFGAYRGYQMPLESLVQDVLQKRTGGRVKIADIKGAEEDIRRAVASAVASRALRIASLASVGVFGLFTAGAFYATGCQTMDEAVVATRRWAHQRRNELDSLLGTEGRVDHLHPEVLATRGMTEDEELAYISKRYLEEEEEWEPGEENDIHSER